MKAGRPARASKRSGGKSDPADALRAARRFRSLRVHASQPVAEQILRTELRRLATHIGAWDRELRANKAQLRQLVTQIMPALPGVGPMSAAQLLVSRPHPGRFRSEAAFSALAGVGPLEASSGKITRHRLNAFGTASSTASCTTSTGGCSTTAQPRPTSPARPDTNRTRTSPLPKRYAARSLYRLMETAART